MASESDWREILGPVDDELLAFHRRLIDVQLRLAELALADLRRSRDVSQTAVAQMLDVSQPNVSRIEQTDDLRLSTLARYIAALGGDLQLRAVFPEGAVELLPAIASRRQ